MCGIVGCISSKNRVSGILIEGLKNLEYRGYDSCGIAVICNPGVKVLKAVGRVADVSGRLSFSKLNGRVGIAHTRWATTGGVNNENAHPHTSCDGNIAVVHNGIISNYKELKESLNSHNFTSETDTEVVAHLVEEYMLSGLDFFEAFRSACADLTGSFALAVIHVDYPDMLLVARNESPLLVGIGVGENFIGSDVTAFINHTRKFVPLDNMTLAKVSYNNVEVFSLESGELVDYDILESQWDYSQASKGGYSHFMIKEIYEQPQIVKQALLQDEDKLRRVAHLIHSSPRVCIVACGTSRHAALVGRYAMSEIAGKICEVYMASEFQYFVDKVGKDSLIIAVSQSGETADVLVPVRKALKNGCKLVSLVNVQGSSLDRESDISLYLNCGPEISVASTKAFTAQLVVFYLIAYTMAFRFDEGRALLSSLPDKISETIRVNEERIKEFSNILKDKRDVYYIARAINFAIASEGALKMKELSYIHAEGMPAGELKHGTLALIESGVPVVVIAPFDNTYDEILNNVHEVKARGALTIGVTDHVNGIFDINLVIPEIERLHYPLLANVPLQLLAYYTAAARGCDVDKPRNLAKSVTVL